MRIIAIIISILLVLFSPIIVTVIYNNILLFMFSMQLRQVDHLISGNYRLLSKYSEIYVGGNGEYCSFRAARIYYAFMSKDNIDMFKNKVMEIKFKSVKSSKFEKVDVHIRQMTPTIIVEINNGPYDAWFDIRCW